MVRQARVKVGGRRAHPTQVSEEWIVLGLTMSHPLPSIDGIELII
jgi:hypothetical protein